MVHAVEVALLTELVPLRLRLRRDRARLLELHLVLRDLVVQIVRALVPMFLRTRSELGTNFWQTLKGPLTAVSKPTVATEESFFQTFLRSTRCTSFYNAPNLTFSA